MTSLAYQIGRKIALRFIAPDLHTYVKSIDAEISAASNSQYLSEIRAYNHTIIESLNSISPLREKRILDIGASPHGYALERCLELGVKQYVGIGLDIKGMKRVHTPRGDGMLQYMNAESLELADEYFDAIVTMSTFEHISDLASTLSEFKRVLRADGRALITFEPVWTCAYGHHLHHFGELHKLIPDWSHLFWLPEKMESYLAERWPAGADLTVQEACNWIYRGDGINRKGIREIESALKNSGMHIEWIVPLRDIPRDEQQMQIAAHHTGLTHDELMTKGLSAFLIKR